MTITRRSLLGKGALLVTSGFLAPSFITRTALALDPAGAAGAGLQAATTLAQDPSRQDKILVVVQLAGGNDGLNTVVPFGDPSYAALRPGLAISPSDALRLADGVGLHPNLARLKALYDRGQVAVIQGVGYPNPNRSHFRSMDIWHSAQPDTFEQSGWLGRYLDACQCAQERTLPAISVGDQLNGMFWSEMTLVPAVASIGAFSFLTDTRYKNDRTFQLQTLQNIYGQAGAWAPYERLIRRGTLQALAGSGQLQQAASGYQTPVQYPASNGLANQLKMVAQVIAGNLGTRLFSVSMGGFDTHANQATTHATLMKQFAEAVDAFLQDLANLKKQDDVALMTFSEFGRRARQNGSGGTDHGTAEPMFVIGNGVRGGLYGTYPSLSNLDRTGDLQFTTDFRSVYAGVLKDQLGADPTPAVGPGFAPLSVMRSPATLSAA